MTRTALKAAAAVVLALGFVLVASSVAHGQPSGKVARVAVLLFRAPATQPNLTAFVTGLRTLGYVEGQNLVFEYRYAEGRPERFRELAVQTAASHPEVIAVLGGDMLPYAKEATGTLPIVFLTSNNPSLPARADRVIR